MRLSVAADITGFNMDITHFKTTEDFVRQSAKWIGSALRIQIEAHGSATIGLSGGSTPRPVYALLATDQSVAWDTVTACLLDERYVPDTSPDSNRHMLEETLFTRAAEHVKKIMPNTALPLDECIADYEKAIAALSLDIAIFGMGEDGHIASLFPPLEPEAFGPAAVIRTVTDHFAVRDRISMTLPVLQRAKQRLFLISGDKKKALLEKIQHESADASLYPAQYLLDEHTTWFVGP